MIIHGILSALSSLY